MTRIRKSLAWAASAILFTSATPGMAAEPAERPLAQLREEFLTWKYGMFIHFNIATYNEREWANGYEDPLTFAPANLDCDQWAAAAKAGGMKYAVLTVKHTEGYSLWDSAHTNHDITAFKNYKDGKGDIVREFVDAFRKQDIKIGFYYCAPGIYDNRKGNTLPEGKPSLQGMPPEAAGDFHGFMKKQFTELFTNYGPIDVFWCDQYKVKLSPAQWHDLKAHIHRMQPNCLVIANNSLDDKNTDIHSFEYPIYRNERGYPKPDNTIPSEVCDTIDSRGNWFWNAKVESQIRPAEEVVAFLRMCNERRANYLLNVAPNRDGRIPDAYVIRMKEIADLWQNQ